jgi:hypothetical protein
MATKAPVSLSWVWRIMTPACLVDDQNGLVTLWRAICGGIVVQPGWGFHRGQQINVFATLRIDCSCI